MSAMKSKRWVAIAGGILLLGGGMSLAGVRDRGTAFAPNEPQAEVADPSKLSAEETLSRSKLLQTQMSGIETRISNLQKRAASKKDMVQVNCTSDKLAQVRGYLTVGNQAAQAVEASVQRRDDAGRAYNFERQSIIHQKVLVLGTEAEGCVGEDVSYVGATKVDVEIDPTIPQEDPTIPGVINVIPISPRPPEASPFA